MRNSKFGFRNEADLVGHARPTQFAFRIPHSACRPGFTLLEVLLAISISVLVLFLVGSVLYQHLRIMDGTRAEVEQAQLARALLRNIGDDLRNVIKYDPQPVSVPPSDSGASGAASAGAAALSGASGSGSGSGSNSGGGSNNGGGSN